MGPRAQKSSFYHDRCESPLGPLYLVFSGRLLCSIHFERPQGIPYKKDSAPRGLIKDMESYFRGEHIEFGQKVKIISGTDFEKSVWSALKKIPFGETRSYKWIAEAIGNPSAVRAVGRALSKNPLPIVIPCHRVIEADGSIGGYSSGVDRKRRLLEIEYYGKINAGLKQRR